MSLMVGSSVRSLAQFKLHLKMSNGSDNSTKSAIVLFEDRPEYEIGIRLLVASLLSSTLAQEIEILVFLPNASASFAEWINSPWLQFSNAYFYLGDDVPEIASAGWNVKPSLLMWALGQGYRRAVWFDSDMIITGELPPALWSSDEGTLVATELQREVQLDEAEHTKGWNLPVAHR